MFLLVLSDISKLESRCDILWLTSRAWPVCFRFVCDAFVHEFICYERSVVVRKFEASHIIESLCLLGMCLRPDFTGIGCLSTQELGYSFDRFYDALSELLTTSLSQL